MAQVAGEFGREGQVAALVAGYGGAVEHDGGVGHHPVEGHEHPAARDGRAVEVLAVDPDALPGGVVPVGPGQPRDGMRHRDAGEPAVVMPGLIGPLDVRPAEQPALAEVVTPRPQRGSRSPRRARASSRSPGAARAEHPERGRYGSCHPAAEHVPARNRRLRHAANYVELRPLPPTFATPAPPRHPPRPATRRGPPPAAARHPPRPVAASTPLAGRVFRIFVRRLSGNDRVGYSPGCAAPGALKRHMTELSLLSHYTSAGRCCWLIRGTPSAGRAPGPAAGRSSAADARIPADRDHASRIPPRGTSPATAHDHANFYASYAPKIFAVKKVFAVMCYGWGSTCLKSGNFWITYPWPPHGARSRRARHGARPGHPGTRAPGHPGTLSAGLRACRRPLRGRPKCQTPRVSSNVSANGLDIATNLCSNMYVANSGRRDPWRPGGWPGGAWGSASPGQHSLTGQGAARS